ncbi:MAG: tetratricopeptide repeat protein [Candidatus Promineifilaceae bacterium]
MKLTLRLLGTFLAAVDDEPLQSFRTQKIQALLAYLAVENGRPHRRDTLATLLWPDTDDKTARKNLRLSYYRLRQSIDEAAGSPISDSLFLSDSHSIQFKPTPDTFWVDVIEFQNLLAECQAHPHTAASECEPCLERWTRAVDLYQGGLLAGFHLDEVDTFDEWFLMARERLHNQTLIALETLIQAGQKRQAYEQVRDFARRQLELEPWSEKAYQALMLAHAHMGQRSIALNLYEACRQVLLDELGVVPDVETESLYEQIRAGKVARQPETPIKTPNNLPSEVTSFIGRDAELETISRQLQNSDHRLITITGPGGQGKTRLSLAVSWRQVTLQNEVGDSGPFPDGVFFIPLDTVEDASKLPQTIAKGLELPSAKDRQPLHSFTIQLLDYLGNKKMLLVLDNFEQLLAGVSLLDNILQGAPGVKFLVTSRERLNYYGEYVCAIGGLAYPSNGKVVDWESYPAIQLFQQRARMVGGLREVGSEDWMHIAKICRLADGLPLAVELAAAWSDMLSPAEIVSEIEANLDFLESELQGLSPRHQNMRVVFDTSWQKLSPDEQDAYAQLSVFQGGFFRQAAEKVAGVSLTILTRLVRKSLLSYDKSRQLYTFHELLRRYSEEKLANHPTLSLPEVQAKHGRYYCTWLAAQTDSLKGQQQIETLSAVNLCLENIRAAWRWAAQSKSISYLNRALNGLAHFFRVQSLFEEGEFAMWQAQRFLENGTDSAEERILLGQLIARRGWFAYFVGRSDEAVALLQEGIDVLEGVEAGQPLVAPLTHLAYVTMTIDLYDKAEGLVHRSLDLSQEYADRYYEAFAWRILGSVYRARGDYSEARNFYERGLKLSKENGDLFSQSIALDSLGICARVDGDLQMAQFYHKEALRLSRRLGDVQGEGWLLHSLATDYWYEGAYEEARTLFDEAGEKAAKFGGVRLQGAVLYRLGNYKWLRGDHAGAREDYRAVIRIHESLNDRQAIGYIWDNIALLTLYEGKTAEAQRYSQEALTLARELGDQSLEGFALVSLGHSLVAEGKLEEARAAYEASLALWQKLERDRPMVKPLAGLALMALEERDQAQALAYTNTILAYLENNNIDGTDEPFRIYSACCQVLLATGDSRSAEFLTRTYERLQARAAEISNPIHRQAFIEEVPFHKEIVEAYKSVCSEK